MTMRKTTAKTTRTQRNSFEMTGPPPGGPPPRAPRRNGSSGSGPASGEVTIVLKNRDIIVEVWGWIWQKENLGTLSSRIARGRGAREFPNAQGQGPKRGKNFVFPVERVRFQSSRGFAQRNQEIIQPAVQPEPGKVNGRDFEKT